MSFWGSNSIKMGTKGLLHATNNSVSKMGRGIFPFLIGFTPNFVMIFPNSVILLPKYGRYFPNCVIQIAQTPNKIKALKSPKNIKRKNCKKNNNLGVVIILMMGFCLYSVAFAPLPYPFSFLCFCYQVITIILAMP